MENTINNFRENHDKKIYHLIKVKKGEKEQKKMFS